MHLLLTNDDGIDAPGLLALEAAVRSLPHCRVSVVAPATEQSMCGHCVTTRRAIAVHEAGEHRWAVEGFAADTVRIALFGLGLRPDWVLSGVNAGGNMGQDVVISGTVAAAREAAYHGLHAAAFSHYLIRGLEVDWRRVTEWTASILQQLLHQTRADGDFWNINFPHHPPGKMEMPETRECRLARSPLQVSFEPAEAGHSSGARAFAYSGRYAERARDPGSDVEACFGGAIAMTKLNLP